MKKTQILIVDDESNMRNLLRLYLTQNGFDVMEADNGFNALELMDQESFDLIILDLMMPGMDGWEVCSQIRETRQTPILMLTARTETQDRVRGLNIGADDYLVKPFEPEELIARVHALLRRSQLTEAAKEQPKKIKRKEMTIDPESRQVFILDRPVKLTPKEFDLLLFLASRSQKVFSRDMLLDHIWGSDYFGDIRTVDTHVKVIREKLRKAGLSDSPIRTVWGVGYQFQGHEHS
ncbi:response regulator transcription factor [Desmospora profundinema]|uniref:Two-component system response regulator ResD n=1 Tax=Desmospora profundinema TaxID=1571184 RepID=A0ABU1IGY7_9BACL|nr:response regulator transcription factor [Desmospora profundinema]MDR6224038.1 two-component system response regulator ResD [Desmospora profundinema]